MSAVPHRRPRRGWPRTRSPGCGRRPRTPAGAVPGPLGELAARELIAYAEFGYRGARDALVPQLVRQVLGLPAAAARRRLSRVSHASRRAALRGLLRAADVEALLVTDLVNVRYLTGFTGSNATLLLHVDGDAASRFCTDGRYDAQSAKEVGDLERVIDRGGALVLARSAGDLGVSRLGFESDVVTVDQHEALVDAAGDTVLLHRTPGLVGRLRLVKDETETAALRAACAVADSALADLIAAGGLRPGRSERDVSYDLETRMRARGAEGPSFATIVAAGSALRGAAPPSDGLVDAPRGPGEDGLRRARRRLPLRHDPHRGARQGRRLAA